MSAPESHTTADAALSSLMGAVIGSPETSAPVASVKTAQPPYGSPADVSQRIEAWIAAHGQQDTASLLLYEAMKALRRSAPAAGDALELPPLNAALTEILGRPNFACMRLAQFMRLSGMHIAKKSEDEQAAVIHYLLGFYLKHGSQWSEKADEDLEQRRAAVAQQSVRKGE